MAAAQYRTAPLATAEMPPGIPYIVGNEAAERFSFYGMRTILVIYMTEFLRASDGSLAVMSKAEASYHYHLFEAGAYLFPIIGGLLSDALWGKYRTIIVLSLVYCLGHVVLSLDETRLGLVAGLALIAVGAGGIKPCVSAHVGDQFGSRNQHLSSRVFAWFYLAINAGAFASSLMTPEYLHYYGPGVAFGVPGVLMFLATWLFWRGRHRFVHIPPAGKSAVREAFGPDGRRALLNLVPLFAFLAAFWSLYDQSGSAWVLQAKQMERHWLGHEWRAEQIQAINPVLILVLVPFFANVAFPKIHRVVALTPLRKIGAGMFLAAGAFSISALIEQSIVAGGRPHVGWQVLAYVILTTAEILIYLTGLEFSYAQAPRKLKSFVMALYLLSISAGNLFTAGVNWFIMRQDGTSRLEGAAYYWFFTEFMLGTAIVFVLFSQFYRGQTYIQEEEPASNDVSGTAAE